MFSKRLKSAYDHATKSIVSLGTSLKQISKSSSPKQLSDTIINNAKPHVEKFINTNFIHTDDINDVDLSKNKEEIIKVKKALDHINFGIDQIVKGVNNKVLTHSVVSHIKNIIENNKNSNIYILEPVNSSQSEESESQLKH